MKYQNSHPFIVDAMRYDGKNYNEICKFCGDKIVTEEYTNNKIVDEDHTEDFVYMTIKAETGYIVVPVGYYLVKTKSNKIYVSNPENFKKEFKAVDVNACTQS